MRLPSVVVTSIDQVAGGVGVAGTGVILGVVYPGVVGTRGYQKHSLSCYSWRDSLYQVNPSYLIAKKCTTIF